MKNIGLKRVALFSKNTILMKNDPAEILLWKYDIVLSPKYNGRYPKLLERHMETLASIYRITNQYIIEFNLPLANRPLSLPLFLHLSFLRPIISIAC